MTELSQLETLLDAVDGDPERAAAFYEALLSCHLYVPVPGTEPISAEAAEAGAKLELLVVQADSGRLMMPVFDSAERALGYTEAQTKTDQAEAASPDAPDAPEGAPPGPHSYAELPARALIRTLDPEIAIVLNPGAERVKVFDKDELRYLRGEIKRLERADRRRQQQTTRKLAFRSVLDLPAEMARDLDRACAGQPPVDAVYILEIEDAARAHGKRYLILLDMGDASDRKALEAAGGAIGEALSGHFMQGTFLELSSLQKEEAYATAIAEKAVPPVWRRGAAG